MNQTIGQTYGKSPFRIAISMGDPSGIGPEVCLKAVYYEQLFDQLSEKPSVFILGSQAVLNSAAERLGLPRLPTISAKDFPTLLLKNNDQDDGSWIGRDEIFDSNQTIIVNFDQSQKVGYRIGEVSADSGDAAFRYLTAAIDYAKNSVVDAIVTGPINKLSLHAAGHVYPGHTEILADQTKTKDYCMMQFSRELICTFATTHIGYADVVSALTTERIDTVIELTHNAVKSILQRDPKIVVCGLNPHAGEDGLFGNREEEEIILPAVQRSRTRGIDVHGPLPPDTCFIPAKRNETDAFVCMYHDQGHIPLKAIAFDQAVNVTLGLPIIRTSVDHGTAFDIAGRGIANPSSMIQAIRLAIQLGSD